QPEVSAKVHFTRIDGTTEEKLASLENIHSFQNLQWRECSTNWTDLFLPVSNTDYGNWAKLTDLFPWQENGIQFKRKWTIGENKEVLQERWQTLINASKSPGTQKKLFKETDARKISKQYPSLEDRGNLLAPIPNLLSKDLPVEPIRYAYRSFDRQWTLLDNRLCDRPRPNLRRSHKTSPKTI
ncbi:MAG: type ISP restriction/modification enzyme, partial [Sphaerospermopsis kisseleviana]